MLAYTPDNIALGIIAEGRRVRTGEGPRDHPVISDKGIKQAIACGLVESELKMYANNGDPESFNFPHDGVSRDKNSAGVFQQRAPWWGTVEDRMDVARSAALFYNSLVKQRIGNQDYNTDATTPGLWVAMVQQCREDLRGKYDKRWADATRIFHTLQDEALPPGRTPPAPPPDTYGMPRGSNSGGYGGNGVRFPDWVYQLGNVFGVKPSTYPGHQESDRVPEAGYAPNPQRLNRGIDWAAPGDPDEIGKLTRFAAYLATIPEHLEQVIWQNPQTMRSIEVAGGRHQPGYFRDDLAGHRDHVHTRQSKPIPSLGGVSVPVPAAKPQFTEIEMFGKGSSSRSRPPINFLIHTQEGPPGHEISDATAKDLAEFCQGQNNVSYHYTIRDRIVYDVVDTDRYSWSVLSANMFTINLCFAGSSVKLTRQQWLDKYGADIDIAAYLAVQDCRKYNFSTEVNKPPYHQGPGISDHKYVTEQLHIGTHTDVGPNFPWDVFEKSVRKYATGEGGGDPVLEMLGMPGNQEKLDWLYECSRRPHMYRKSANETIDDTFGWEDRVEYCARLGEKWALDLIDAATKGTLFGVLKPDGTPDQFLVDHAIAVANSVDVDKLIAWRESSK